MVKRITASLLLVLVGAISILAQIDYNKQIKNAPAVSQGNMNGVRVVDGLKFAQSAAGINAADADLGTAFGEIWIPSTPLAGITATDAQISISKNHTLRLMGRLNIDSVNKGPILLATGSKIICNDTDTSPIINVGVGTSPSVIRLAVQDGSVTSGLFVEGCLISAGIQPVTNGVIDASGSANLAYIRNNYIFGFTSGWGIFVQDIQSGALAGTTNLAIQGNNITASNPGSGGCIDITHSATNNVTINNISIIDTTCIPGPSLAVGAPIVAQNTSAATHVQQINLLNVNIFSNPASQEGVYINGVFQETLKHIFCGGGTSCVYIASNTNNLAISAENVACSGCTNVFQDIANNYVNSNNYINHYGFNATSQGFSGNNILEGVTQTGNFNNIRIVDGVRFAQNAAGINAADADLGATSGEIWVPAPTFTATDAQISIGLKHTLRVFGNLTIDAAGKGPILLGNAAGVICVNPNTAIQQGTSGAGITSMIRATAQDGSQASNFIVGCQFFGNTATPGLGVIDFSGFRQSWIRDILINSFNSGMGLYAADIQSGALAGTFDVQLNNINIFANNTGGCFEIIHSSTNNVTLAFFDIQHINCTVSASFAGSAALIQNPAASASTNMRQFHISNLTIAGVPVGQFAFAINGANNVLIHSLSCTGGGNMTCLEISNNANNLGIVADETNCYGCLNSILDAANGFQTGNNSIAHYDFSSTTASLNNSFFNMVSYLRVQGLTPATPTGTGCGTGCAVSLNPGSTNNAGILQVVTGTTPGSSGTFVLNFNTTQSVFGVNPPVCVFTLGNASGTWNARASLFLSGLSTSAATVAWDNNAVNLTASVQYNVTYWCAAK